MFYTNIYMYTCVCENIYIYAYNVGVRSFGLKAGNPKQKGNKEPFGTPQPLNPFRVQGLELKDDSLELNYPSPPKQEVNFLGTKAAARPLAGFLGMELWGLQFVAMLSAKGV